MAKSSLGQNGNSAIKGFSWTAPVSTAPTVIAPGMSPELPVLTRYPIEQPDQPRLVHGLPVSIAKRIHSTLMYPADAVTERDLYPAANRGQDLTQRPASRDGVLVPVYDSETGAPKVDRFGVPVLKTIPYLGGDRLTGPFAAEFRDPGPAQFAAKNAAAAATIPGPAWREALKHGQTWQGPHTDVPAGFTPPVNPTKPRVTIAGNKGKGPQRGGVTGGTNLPG